MLIFEDRSPKATAHYLCVPKKHIKDTNSLKSTDIPSSNSSIFFFSLRINNFILQFKITLKVEKMVQIADVELNRLFPGSEKRF